LKERDPVPDSESRRDYVASRSRDYTRYTSLVGEGLSSKVDLLAQVLGDVHEPSLGRYKERLLADAISSFIPSRYEVATGFVLFPRTRLFAGEVPSHFNYLNSSDFEPSRQCDILVFDASHYPPVFRDGDFAVLRPESVRAVIEVKGTLSPKSIADAVDHAVDFGTKWRTCAAFYRASHNEPLHRPFLAAMAWRMGVDRIGRPLTNGRRIREQLVRRYSKVPKSDVRGLPVVEHFFLHRQFEVMALTYESKGGSWSFGFMTQRGQAVRFSAGGQPALAGDSTVNSLLAGIHANLETPYNRFFSHSDQSNSSGVFDHPDSGYTPWLLGDESNLPWEDL